MPRLNNRVSIRGVLEREPWVLASLWGLALCGCSLKSLDELQSETGKFEANAGQSSTSETDEPKATGGHGGTLSSSPSSRGGASSRGGEGGTTQRNSGGTTGSSTEDTVTGGIASIGGTTSTGGTTSVITGGASSTGGVASMVYGVQDQSCSRGVTCPNGVSCCTQIEVSAASFSMGTNSDTLQGNEELPPHTTTLDTFTMDKFEVTVGRFRSFVLAFDGTLPQTGMGAHPKITNSGWQVGYDANMPASKGALLSSINCSIGNYQTYTETEGVRESMPMNCVSWYLAFAFCVWDGGRLPTEAEWEMAASSGSKEYRFPWGSSDPEPAAHAVMNCMGDGVSGCTPSDLLAVGSRPAGANTWGHLDLAGSLWEWTLDYYDATYYQAVGNCNNCSNLSGTTPRVIRGGNFTSVLKALRATGRASKAPVTVDSYAGFRCVRSL